MSLNAIQLVEERPRTGSSSGRTRAPRLIQTVAVLALTLHAAYVFMHSQTGEYCCDADYYQMVSGLFLSQWSLPADQFDGYRSYFTPLVVGVINTFGPFSADARPPFSVNAALMSVTVSALLTLFYWRTCLTRFLVFAVATVYNPVLSVYGVYPLQEGVFVLVGLPLILVRWLIGTGGRTAL